MLITFLNEKKIKHHHWSIKPKKAKLMGTIFTNDDLASKKPNHEIESDLQSRVTNNQFFGLIFLFLSVFIFNSNKTYSQSGNCTLNTPFYVVNLVGNPGGSWTSPPFIRDGYCCGVTNPERCLEFEITLDPNSVGIIFSISSGAIPPGAIFYQVNCGPPTLLGTGVCLNTPGPHSITFCKPGNNENTYSIASISAPFVSADQYASLACPASVTATGFDPSTIIWTDITGNGIYESYLSCTAACSTVMVTPQASHPTFVDYMVCGESMMQGCLDSIIFCDTVRIFFVDDLSLSVTPTPAEFCADEGGITLSGSFTNGLPQYTSFWTNNINGTGSVVDNDNIFYATNSGNYSYVIYDSRYPSCPATYINVPVISHPNPSISVSTINSSVCFGTPVIYNVSGAVTYNWSPAVGLSSTTGSSVTATPSVTTIYTITGTDAFGCTNSTTVTYTPLPLPVIETVYGDTICFGSANGSASVGYSGGTSPYSYLWSNGAITFINNNLNPGIYSVTVSDINGCIASASAIISETPLLISNVSSSANVSCFAGNNGTASISATGGTPPYIYNWSNAANTATINGLSAGNYSVTVTDNNNCTSTASVVITQATLLTSGVSASTNVSCFGGNNGTASVIVNGGTTPYTYNWSNGANTAIINGLITGNYFVTVTDNNGCITNASVIIAQPTLLTSGITAFANISCFGENNGTATVSANGGTTPYTYNWSNGANTATINSLIAGNYYVTVTDNNECTSISSVVITQPILLTSSIAGSTNASCFGGNNGTASVTVNGGISPYTYNWSNGANTPTINGLTAGNYSVTLTDNNGCTSAASIVITQPALLTFSGLSSTNVSCNGGNNGAATVTSTGGTPPYYYNWSNGANTSSISGLLSGIYSVTLTDNNACISLATVVITQPPLLTISSLTATNVSCFGGNNGTAIATANGGTPPYFYNWSNGAITSNISGLISSNYSVILTDNNGCISLASVVISQPPQLTVSILTSNNVSCFGENTGIATVTVNGGTAPYYYNWSNGAITSTINGLLAGNYVVTVTDNNACSSLASVVITQPPLLNAGVYASSNVSCYGGSNGTASVTVSGGTIPYTYNWSNGANTASINGLTAGNYFVTVYDNNGCISIASTAIIQPMLLTFNSLASTNVSCYGGNNGTAVVTANGGTPPYFYYWSNGANTSNITGLLSGNYSIILTDNNGCMSLASVFITQPPVLSAGILASSNVSCFGGNNGTAVVSVNGGTAPYTYYWTNGANTVAVNGLYAGNYVVTVSDNNGCTSTASVDITQPPLLTAGIFSSANASCTGENDGSATVTANGGTFPYNYTWSNSLNTSNITGLIAGNYTVTVSDNNACIATASVTITESTPLDPNFDPIPEFCYGSSAPVLLTTSPNGISGTWNPAVVSNTTSGNYTFTPYAWQCANPQTLNVIITPQVVPNIINIPPFCSGSTAPILPNPVGISGDWVPATVNNTTSGIYTFTPDDGECATPQTIYVTVISQTVPDFEQIPAFCFGSVAPVLTNSSPNGIFGTWNPQTINNTSSGSYTFTPFIGQCATSQTLNVTVTPQIVPEFVPIPAFCAGTIAPVLINTSTNGIYGTWTPSVINNTTSGIYTFTPDSWQCATNLSLPITVNPLPSIIATAFPSTICNGQNSILTVVGANTYSWMPGNLSGSSINVSPDAETVYTVTGTTSAGCTGSASVSVAIAPETVINFISLPKEGCYPLNVQFNFINNGNIDTNSLHWNFGDPLTNEDVSNLLSPEYTYNNQGNFIVSISGVSIYGCSVLAYDTINVWPQPKADFMTHPEVGETDDPLIYFYDQSLGAVSWNWNFGNPQSGSNNYSDLQYPSHYYTDSGSFAVQLIVSNEYECHDTAVKMVKINESFAFYIPNAFTPNGDGNNEGFRGKGVGIDENKFEMYVFDRWGKEIFKTRDLNEAWDGKDSKKRVDCEQAIYVWIIDLTEKSGLQHSLKGTVTLIR